MLKANKYEEPARVILWKRYFKWKIEADTPRSQKNARTGRFCMNKSKKQFAQLTIYQFQTPLVQIAVFCRRTWSHIVLMPVVMLI